MKLQDLFESKIEYLVSQKIMKEIKKAAMDPATVVKRAVELVQQVYNQNNVTIPTNPTKMSYKQYIDHFTYAVKQLHAATAKGVRDDSWKFTPDKEPI